MLNTRALIGGYLVACTLVLAGASAAAENPFRNVWNAPFAAVSNGPQGAIVVEHHGSARLTDTASLNRAVQDAIARQHSEAALSQAVEAMRFMRTRGLKSRKAEIRVPRMIVHTSRGRPILPDLDRVTQTGGTIGDPNNNITFEFDGWSPADRTDFETYLAGAMPIARAIYGPPAFDITVKIIKDAKLRALQGGTYDVTTNELRLPPLPPRNERNWPEDTFVLMLLVLNAFRDDVALFFDGWEQGMIGAAATAVQISPGVSPLYDPANPGPFYSGSVYDPMNLPALGNSTWFPASGFSGMLVWRIAQSRAAWLKCYTEDPQFFARFNAQYYARLNFLSPAQRATLPGDAPSLLEICATVLPSVEGTSFFSWIRQQYALDPSVTVGLKLYTWNIPLFDAVALIVEHYETDPAGNEIPRGGKARLAYFNYSFTLTLFAQEGNEIDIPGTGPSAGEGFLIPTFFNVGGPQRITVQIEINGLFARYPFPYNVRGFDPDENNLYGAMIGPTEGTINVKGLEGLKDVKVERGVWGGIVSKTTMSPAQLEVTFEDKNGNQITRKVNVAFDTYDVLMAAGVRGGLAKHLSVGTNGLYLFSVPLLPVMSDPAAALGIPADEIMLARWKPNAPGGGRYQFYPTIDPMAPGRGYWLRILADVTVAVDGIIPADNDDVITRLFAGWNMIGCARNRNVKVADLLIQRGAADSKALSAAVNAGWVQGGVWGYGQRSGYKLVQTLEPFEGYWIRALLPEGSTLVFPARPTTTSLKADSTLATYSPFGRTTWHAPIVLRHGAASSQVTIGTAASATDGYDAQHDLQAPPAFGDHPAIRFAKPDWGENAGEYASDIRGESARGPWRLRVANVAPGSRAQLRWPDLSPVPPGLRPVLIDRSTGREIYMRTSAGYQFTGARAPREFEIELRGAQGALAVMGLLGLPTRRGVTITYSLTADAAVTARVVNIAGRPIRDLVSRKPQPAGRSTLLWDLKSSTGSLVPNGTYLIELTARSEDGQVARGMNKVSVTR